MANIYLDAFKLRPTGNEFEVLNEATYVEARKRLLAQAHQRSSPVGDFVVRDAPFTHWFNDLPERIIRITPLAELQKAYPAAKLAKGLTDHDVLELKLLKAAVSDPSEATILKFFFNSLLPSTSLKGEFLYQLSGYVVAQQELLKTRYLKQLWQEQLAHLPSPLAPLRAADFAFAQILNEGYYLRWWPELLADWEHRHAAKLKKDFNILIKDLGQYISKADGSVDIKTDYTSQEEKYEARIQKKAAQTLQEQSKHFLDLPGRYKGEVAAIVEYGPVLKAEHLTGLESKYAGYLAADPKLHKRLQALVPPVLLNPEVSVDIPLIQQWKRWRDWAIGSFIPYKFWLDLLNVRSEEQVQEVESKSVLYGDWLHKNYSSLMNHEDVRTNRGVSKIIGSLLQKPNTRVIWLIIDGLPAIYLDLLLAILRGKGFNRITTEHALAPLPTITEIGIPALLTGLRPDAQAYTIDREKGLAQTFPQATTLFSSAPGKFAKLLAEESDVCCLHFIEIDLFQHKPESQVWGTRAEEIEAEILKLVEAIATSIKLDSEHNTKLVVSTDHGATKCLRNGSGIINAKIQESAVKSHERCIKLSGSLKKEHIDEANTYHLSTQLTNNQEEWVVARGYHYFGANDTGYRHGGLSPEETIVPVVIAEMVDFDHEELIVSYFGSKELVLGKTIREVGFQIYNPNSFAVQLLGLDVQEDPNTQFVLPLTLEANESVTLKTMLKLPRTLKPVSGFVNAALSLTYRTQGEELTIKVKCPVPIQKANELDEVDFDNL